MPGVPRQKTSHAGTSAGGHQLVGSVVERGDLGRRRRRDRDRVTVVEEVDRADVRAGLDPDRVGLAHDGDVRGLLVRTVGDHRNRLDPVDGLEHPGAERAGQAEEGVGHLVLPQQVGEIGQALVGDRHLDPLAGRKPGGGRAEPAAPVLLACLPVDRPADLADPHGHPVDGVRAVGVGPPVAQLEGPWVPALEDRLHPHGGGVLQRVVRRPQGVVAAHAGDAVVGRGRARARRRETGRRARGARRGRVRERRNRRWCWCTRSPARGRRLTRGRDAERASHTTDSSTGPH